MNSDKNNRNAKRKLLVLLPYILIPAMILAGLSYYISSQSTEKLEYYELVSMFDEGKITEYKLNLSSGALVYKTADSDKEMTFTVPSVSLFVEDIHEGVIEYNRAHPDSMIKAGYVTGSTGQWIYNIVPTLLLLVQWVC